MSLRAKTLFINSAVFAAALLLWALAMEGACRWWLRHHGDPLDRAIFLLQPDECLLWRQKPEFKGSFEGQPVRTNELGLRGESLELFKKARKKVLILGPSSAFGWGVARQDTYSNLLEKLLSARHAQTAVLNAGEIGYASSQGLLFYAGQLRELKPDLVIVAYGANDPDRHRFFRNSPEPDSCLLEGRQGPQCLKQERTTHENLLARFKTLYLASRLAGKAAANINCRNSLNFPIPPPMRVPPEDFRKNLLALARATSDDGAKLLFLGTAHDYLAAPLLPSATLANANKKLEAGKKALENGDHRQAADLLEAAAEANPYDSGIRYLLSAAQARLDNCRQAAQELAIARRLEQYRLNTDYALYNKIMKEAASLSGAPFLPLQDRLSDKRFFLDPIHFSRVGHAVVAQELAHTIETRRLLGK